MTRHFTKSALSFAAIAALGLTACLQPSTGATTGGVGSDAGNDAPSSVDAALDVSQDSGQDSGGQDSGSDIGFPWCSDFIVLCDDGNPCTTDSCDVAKQGCIYTPVPDGSPCGECGGSCNAGDCFETLNIDTPAEPPECSDASDCDDGDPCTMASCECELAENPGPCGPKWGEWCWCNQFPTPDAPGCNPEPPTNACSSAGAITVEEALTVPNGTFVKVGGAPAMSKYADCDDDQCGDCWGGIVINDAPGDTLALDPGVQDTFGLPWGCKTFECAAKVECHPMVAKTDYWAWGTVEDYEPFGDETLKERKLVLQGWCLQSPASTFAGVYSGTIQAHIGAAYTVTMTLSLAGDGTWQVSLGQIGDLPPQQAYNVVVNEGSLVFEAAVPDGFAQWFQVTLQTDENDLWGPYIPWSKSVDAAPGLPVVPVVPIGGLVYLTREI